MSVAPDVLAAVREEVRRNPGQMTLQVARRFGVPEVEVVRAFPDGRAVPLDASRVEELVRTLEALGPVHVIVSNGAVTLEAFGSFGNFSVWGEFLNVQTKSLDMHIRYKQLSEAFAVEKPGHMDGVATYSVQFFDTTGAAAFKVFVNFGGSAPPPERMAKFTEIRERFRRSGS